MILNDQVVKIETARRRNWYRQTERYTERYRKTKFESREPEKEKQVKTDKEICRHREIERPSL